MTRFSKDWYQACKGQHLEVYWPLDEQFYEGKVMKIQMTRKDGKCACVHYEDGDKEWLDLRKETYSFKRRGHSNNSSNNNNHDDDDDDGDDGAVPPSSSSASRGRGNPDESGQDSEIDESDAKMASTSNHSTRSLKRKRSADSNDESEAPPKKRTRPTRGRPKTRKRQAAEEDSDSDSEMRDARSQPHQSRGHSNNSGNRSRTGRSHGGSSNGSKKHGKNAFSGKGQHDPSSGSSSHMAPAPVTLGANVSNQVPSVFSPHERSNGPAHNTVSLSNTPPSTPNGLSVAGTHLAARVSESGMGNPNSNNNSNTNNNNAHVPMMGPSMSVAETMIDKHVTVIDSGVEYHDAVIIDYRNAGAGGQMCEYQVQYDESEETLWVPAHEIREQQSTESEKGVKNGFVLALDNNQWFKGVVEDILVGVNGPIFRIAFPQFDSSPFMYFPDKRVREYRQEDNNVQI